MAVRRAVSSRLGHTDLRSSEMVSWIKVTGVVPPMARGDMGGLRRVETRAMSYLTSRCVLWTRQREQYFLNSIRWVSFRRFLMVE